jgi:hypothetical protein
MAQGATSLIRAGQVVSGVCYATPDRYTTHIAAIPPERVGLSGEYDHYGLAKRVQADFHRHFGRPAIAQLLIKQRGSAVILSGQVDSEAMVEQLIARAIATEGTTHVEVRHILINDLERDTENVGTYRVQVA